MMFKLCMITFVCLKSRKIMFYKTIIIIKYFEYNGC